MCSVGKLIRRSWLTKLAGQFKDVFCRLGIEAADCTLAGAVPHSTPVLTDGALNLVIDVMVTGTTTFVMFLSLSIFSNWLKIGLASLSKGTNSNRQEALQLNIKLPKVVRNDDFLCHLALKTFY